MDGLAIAMDGTFGLDRVIREASGALKRYQKPDGHWVFELEADSTIPAEYVLLRHYLADIDPELDARIGRYLRKEQGAHGGWSLFYGGDFDMSASVKAYFALKMLGDDPDAPHMRRAREIILRHGGAAAANVLTRYQLALFGEIPWRGVPVMMAEVMLLPRWFPFHLSKMSYWSRTVIVPLLILTALKPKARNPRDIHIRELFVRPPEEEKHYNTNPTGSFWGNVLLHGNNLARHLDALVPNALRRRAIRKALAFIQKRMNGEDGLGAIYPAMANLVMAFDALGYPHDHPDMVTARKAVDRLLVFREDGSAYCQPCMSPVWDTGITAHALLEAGTPADVDAALAGLDWLRERQILETVGDYADGKEDSMPAPGGWAFQYRNDYFPDVDDTAMVGMALHRADPERYKENIRRAAEWVIGLQSRNGGWGAYDRDNTYHYLDHIPFADHGALLDPPSADVTARCIGFLAQAGYGLEHPAVKRGVDYLLNEQEADGSWFGRWGANYVYGTWSVLAALNAVGMDHQSEPMRRAVDWLVTRQRPDGGWGEDCATYWKHRQTEAKASTASQTAWGVLALMAAGEVDHEATARGITYLKDAPRNAVRWEENYFTGVGFPRVFYLKYHGYAAFFPLWALARYRNLTQRNDRRVQWGI